MKISEMTGEKAFEIMAKLAPYIQNISDDEGIRQAKLIRNDSRNTTDTAEIQKSAEGFLWNVIPRMIGEHRDDLFGIVSVLRGCTAEDVQKLSFAEIMETLTSAEMFDILPFFRFAVRVSGAI